METTRATRISTAVLPLVLMHTVRVCVCVCARVCELCLCVNDVNLLTCLRALCLGAYPYVLVCGVRALSCWLCRKFFSLVTYNSFLS